MSEPEQHGRHAPETAEGSDETASAETPALSDSGVGLGVTEPNTFEPEEAEPAPDSSTE